MNCSNQRPRNDNMVVCKKACHKNNVMQRTDSKSWPGKKSYHTKNAEILKSCHKRWYENNREKLARSQRTHCQQNKEQIRNYQRQYCKNNRERINEYWTSYHAKNKEQIRQRLHDQKQRKVGQNIVCIGAWDQEFEKLEMSLVPSDTFCETPIRSRLKVVITSFFGFHVVIMQETS